MRRETHPPARTADGTIQDVRALELVRNLARRLVRATKLKTGRAPDDLHSGSAGQTLDDLLRYPVREELHLPIIRQVVEGQHGEKRLAALGGRRDDGRPNCTERECLDLLRHLVELQDPPRDETLGQRSSDRAMHVSRHQRRARIAASHQARRNVDPVAQEIAVRLHEYVAQMHANAQLGLALFRQRERGFNSGQTRTELKHEAITRRVEHPATTRPGDAFDHAPQGRHFGRGPGFIGFRPRGVARNVRRDDGGESAGLGIFGHEGASVRTFGSRHCSSFLRAGKSDCCSAARGAVGTGGWVGGNETLAATHTLAHVFLFDL